jgi:hypothetical protein
MIIGAIAGWLTSSIFGVAWGWFLGIATCLALDFKAAKKYYEIGMDKK